MTPPSCVILFVYYFVKYLCSMQQFAPGSSSEVLITSADSRIRVVNGDEFVHKFKGNASFSWNVNHNTWFIFQIVTCTIFLQNIKGVYLPYDLYKLL